MSFGKRTEFPGRSSAIHTSASTPQTRPGGYWLGLLTVPITMLIIMTVGCLIIAPDQIDRLYPALAPAALGAIMLASVTLLLSDVVLRLIGLRQVWVYALVCAVTLYGVSFVVGGMSPGWRFAFMFFPGLMGGLVLGWSRR